MIHADVVQAQSEYAADPQLPYSSWRYSKNWRAAAHCMTSGPTRLTLAMFLCGELEEILGAAETTVIGSRFLPVAATAGHGHAELSAEQRAVDTDDLCSAVMRFEERLPGPFFRQPGRGGHGQHALLLPPPGPSAR